MLLPNTILRDRYRIIHELGHGGMGTVYQAMDENLSCLVAVKETFAVNDEQRRAFRREAELLANLSHPTLPRVMDHFTHGEGQFVVMQFVPGHDLAELLEIREQPFSLAKVLDWADQLLDGLEELHSSNPPIVHRDIKPSNLKVTPKDKILLLDFGLAKGVAGQMSTADVDSHGKSVYGYTPNYAPLEQIRSVGTDPRSDLYSLSATLWTLLTGKVPPDALSRVAEKEEGNPDPLRPAHEFNPQVPAAVSSALNRAMSVNRNQRHASAAELRSELRNLHQAEIEPRTAPTQEDPPVPSAPSAPQSPQPTIKTPEPLLLSPTVASFAREAEQQESRFSFHFRWGRVALIMASLLVVATSIIVWRSAVERPKNLTGIAPTQRDNQANTATPSNVAAPAGMVYVPGGEFTIGRDDGDLAERPAHRVTVKPFYIDIYEVTQEDYEKSVVPTREYPSSAQIAHRKPVTGVTWDAATRYCQWAEKRLPTEEQWEFGARGTDGRLYPWGNEWASGLANGNSAAKGVVDVGTFKGTSPFGLFDMVGNAWEWTDSPFAGYPGQVSVKPDDTMRVIRGGSYESDKDSSTTTYRRGYPKHGNYDYSKTGFRCVKDVN